MSSQQPEDGLRRIDNAAERLRKEIHATARRPICDDSVAACVAELEAVLGQIARLFKMRESHLETEQASRLATSILDGIAEKTQSVKIRFLDNN